MLRPVASGRRWCRRREELGYVIEWEQEAIVVGTGFAGAVAACRLAQAGLRVLVLERGRRFESADFPDLPHGGGLPDLERWSWQTHRGLWDTQDLGPVVSAQAAGYGGGSLIYANVQLRPPSDVFADWPAGYDEATLREHYDLAAWMLEIAPIDSSQELAPLPKTRGFDVAASKLGRTEQTFHPPLALRYAAGPNAFGKELRACNGCGRCCLGCPHEAKSSLDHNYLYLAEQYPNLRVKTRCEVLRVDALAQGYAVTYRDGLSGDEPVEVRARYVFLCAGALGTTLLLARSARHAERDSARGLAKLSKRLGRGYFANGDAVSLVFDTPDAHEPTRGPTITTSTIHRDGKDFVLLQDGGYPRELARAADAFAAPAWLAKNRFRSGAPGARPRAVRPTSFDPPVIDGGLTSPLDTFGQALASGALDDAVPVQLRQAVAALRKELLADTRPEFEQLVDGMIERSLQTLVTRSTGRWLSEGSRAREHVLGWLRRLTLGYLTDRKELATFAQRAFFERFGLLETSAAVPRSLARGLGSEVAHAERGTVLLAMGRDTAEGELCYDTERDRLSAKPSGARGFDVLSAGERLKRDMVEAMGGELRSSPLVALQGKPMTVHSQGGAGMGATPEMGVTNLEGEVHGHPGLFVLDAACFPASVGVNPSATILAVAERNVLGFLRRLKAAPDWPCHDPSPGAQQLQQQRARARGWALEAATRFDFGPPVAAPRPLTSEPIGLRFGETFSGFLAPVADLPRDEAVYYELETQGRRFGQCVFELQIEIPDLDRFWRDPERHARLSGRAACTFPDGVRHDDCKIRGDLQLLVAGSLVPDLPGDPTDRFFLYSMQLVAPSGAEATVRMYKRMPRGFDRLAWRGTSRCYARLFGEGATRAGIMRVDLSRFVFRTLPSMHVTGTTDPARIAWALAEFAGYFGAGFGTRRSQGPSPLVP
jgi:choline dehydrogenase-like flavoprotein